MHDAHPHNAYTLTHTGASEHVARATTTMQACRRQTDCGHEQMVPGLWRHARGALAIVVTCHRYLNPNPNPMFNIGCVP